MGKVLGLPGKALWACCLDDWPTVGASPSEGVEISKTRPAGIIVNSVGIASAISHRSAHDIEVRCRFLPHRGVPQTSGKEPDTETECRFAHQGY